jgi:hypothetical protein
MSVDRHECSNLNLGSELLVVGCKPRAQLRVPCGFLLLTFNLVGFKICEPPSYTLLYELTSIDPNDLKNNEWLVRSAARLPDLRP